MADNNNQRPYRVTNEPGRPAARGASGNDPLAELARLIGQTDPFAEFGRNQPNQQQAMPSRAPEWPTRDWQQQAPSAVPEHSYGAAGQSYDEPGYEHSAQPGEEGYDQATYAAAQGYDPGDAQGQGDYDDAPPPRRGRFGILAIAAVLALAVVGTAGAYGYRAMFGSAGSSPPPVIKADTTPAKIVPPKPEGQSNKLIYDRVGDRGNNEKIVSREEQPIDIKDKVPPAMMADAQPGAAGVGAVAAPTAPAFAAPDQPKKIHTIVIRPDQPQGVADMAAPAAPQSPPQRQAAVEPPASAAPSEPKPAPKPAPPRRSASTPVHTAEAEQPVRPAHTQPARNVPLSLSPNAAPAAPPPARHEPVRTASAPTRLAPPAATGSASGGYAVQVSAQRSEAEAQAAFRSLQGKYPSQLGGRQVTIRRADLGSKGVYYRAMVGPFSSSAEASQLCQSLKSAGASCLIQHL
ncbi:MAG: hypothetical protein OJF62_003509 [Pseudolabrys sp.]|jgi:hypothetical protein|nr:hypothetical protein [Pseudolabrys sp.]